MPVDHEEDTYMEKKEAAMTEPYETIEHWYNLHATGPAMYAGAMCHKGWKPEKKVTENEYLAAISEFGRASMAGTGGGK